MKVTVLLAMGLVLTPAVWPQNPPPFRVGGGSAPGRTFGTLRVRCNQRMVVYDATGPFDNATRLGWMTVFSSRDPGMRSRGYDELMISLPASVSRGQEYSSENAMVPNDSFGIPPLPQLGEGGLVKYRNRRGREAVMAWPLPMGSVEMQDGEFRLRIEDWGGRGGTCKARFAAVFRPLLGRDSDEFEDGVLEVQIRR